MVDGMQRSYDGWHLESLRMEFGTLISNGDGRRRLQMRLRVKFLRLMVDGV